MSSNNNNSSFSSERESFIKKMGGQVYDNRRSSSFISPNKDSGQFYAINDEGSFRTPLQNRHSFVEESKRPDRTQNPYLKHHKDKTLSNTDDLLLTFEDVPNKKKGSSDGSGEDVESDNEQTQYFQNEEKVIKNHLKLNVCLQILQIVIFILSATIFDWTHVIVGEDSQIQTYHISLVKVQSSDDVQSPIWLYTLTDNCLNKGDGESVSMNLSQQLCERAGSLFLAGAFTMLGLIIAVLINVYNTLILMLFIKRLQLTGYQFVFFRYLVHVYMFVIIFYFVVSMSFIYLTQMGLGLCFSIVGVILIAVSRRHFLKLYGRIKHMQLVKTLVIEDQQPPQLQ